MSNTGSSAPTTAQLYVVDLEVEGQLITTRVPLPQDLAERLGEIMAQEARDRGKALTFKIVPYTWQQLTPHPMERT